MTVIPFDVRPVTSIVELEEVYRMTHECYVASAYSENQPNGLLLHYPEYDVIPETTVLVARQDGKIIGTVSLTVPGPFGFTLDRDFKKEISQLQNEGRRLGVIWRLVIANEYRSSRAVLTSLISSVVRKFLNNGLNTYLFEVNPKHERVYKRMLNMTTVSRIDGADGLQHAPGVLLRGDTENLPEEWALAGQELKAHDAIGLAMLDHLLEPLPGIRKAS